MIERVDAIAIGAGVSGLAFANAYAPKGRVVVLERDPDIGGYCKTVTRDGFVWDYSGHFFHFKHPDIEAWLRARMPGQQIRTVEKHSLIRYRGRDIDFPFQKNIHQLDKDELVECLVDLFFRPGGDGPPASFADMLYRRLGRSITDKFLRPYNEKLYATDLNLLDPDAMGRFFPHADIADIIANMRPGAARDGGYNATFTYPDGGAIQYIRALAHDLAPGTIATDEPVLAIDLAKRTVTTPKRTLGFTHLVSSAPLSDLARICGVPHAPVFTSNKVLVFNLGFDGKGARGVHWMYFPDPACVFYRVGWYDNILDGDRMSLYVEIGAPTGATFDVDELRERVLSHLQREGIVTTQKLVAHHHVVLDPAYAHITKASLAEVARLRGILAASGVHSVGRYGGWTYCSIEDNIVETRQLAAAL